MRLDQYLKENIEGISRNYAQYLISNGHVTAANPNIDRSTIVKPGDIYYVDIPPPKPTEMLPLQEKLDILFEDEHLIVLNKRAGMTVHPGAGTHNDTLVNALVAHCGNNLSSIGGELRPGIVHRLDKDTSGLMVVAKDDQSHRSLSTAIAERKLERKYLAIVWDAPCPSSGIIDIPIGRHPKEGKIMCVDRQKGRQAITYYKLIKTFNNKATSLVECRLKTGRTHQIRVHLNHIGNSIIGDQTYGKRTRKSKIGFARQALHSHYLSLEHPVHKKLLEFSKEIPNDMQNLISSLEQ
jgi:23S rRNA pseudouridine1911/1915/1917 synthase